MYEFLLYSQTANSFSEPSRNIADNEGESRGGSNLMAQAVSMSNNLKDDLNSPVNIQGDGEIGKHHIEHRIVCVELLLVRTFVLVL